MERSESIIELMKALVSAKKSFGKIDKNQKNTFKNYGYADLGELFSKTQTALCENGLHVFQGVESTDTSYTVTTTLAHVSGEFISQTVKLPSFEAPSKGNTFIQELGTLITYQKRYQYAALLGLDANVDLDGEIEAVVTVKVDLGALKTQILDVFDEYPQLEEEVLSKAKVNSFDQIDPKRYENILKHLKSKIAP